jgi:gliding motility-associated-like protein
MRLLFCTFILLVTVTTQAQINNLVPNPSFELYTSCPPSYLSIFHASNWFQPFNVIGFNIIQSNSSDYFNTCAIDDYSSIPLNGAGYQEPKTGDAYVGIYLYSNPTGDSREYIETTLISPLQQGKEYCVELYVSLADSFDTGCNNFGVYFSIDSALYQGEITEPGTNFNVEPQIENSEIITDKINWTLIKGSYIASGGENYITIGNFRTGSATSAQFVGGAPDYGGSYYYIDDVSVFLCSDTLPQPIDLIIPNIFSPNNDEWNNQYLVENLPEGATVEIYNRWGTLVAEWNTPNGTWDGRTKGGAESSAGVYYCIVKLVNGELKSSFLQLLR